MLATDRQTGYPHIDKPWLKYYDVSTFSFEYPKMSIYDYYMSMTKGYDDKVAITYYGKTITYLEMKEQIKRTAKMLLALGVGEKERVMFLMPNVPETAYLMYACSVIGAVADFVDPRPDSIDRKISSEKILSLFRTEKSTYIIALDLCFYGIVVLCFGEFVIAGMKKCIVVPANMSMDAKSKAFYIREQIATKGIGITINDLKQSKCVKNFIDQYSGQHTDYIVNYAEALEKSKDREIIKWNYKENEIAVIVHSSGTSGTKPKPIPFTNDNMNAYIHQTFVSNMPMKVADNVLHILPYFAAFGIVDVAHTGFCHVSNLIQLTSFEPRFMGYWIKKCRPQTIIGTPAWYMLLVDDENLRNIDLSCLKMITYGGDSMTCDEEQSLNKFLKNHNCGHKVTKGHGMSEICGCGSYANNEYNALGSIGIPMAYSTYGVINPETLEAIKFEENDEYIEGELIISSPMVFGGKLDGIEYASFIDIDGERFIRTKDIARMDRNGIMYFLSRSDRTFTRYDGYKLKPYELEKIVCESELVKKCCVTPFYDENKKGLMPRLSIVAENILNDSEKKQYVNYLINEVFCMNAQISSRQIPARVSIVNELPMTENGKVNYKALEKPCDDDLQIIFEESSISLGEIQIQ